MVIFGSVPAPPNVSSSGWFRLPPRKPPLPSIFVTTIVILGHLSEGLSCQLVSEIQGLTASHYASDRASCRGAVIASIRGVRGIFASGEVLRSHQRGQLRAFFNCLQCEIHRVVG